MNGLEALFWSIAYEGYNLLRNPSRRWEAECAFCDETRRARSRNMALTKVSLHVQFSDDHPDGPEDTDLDWSNGGPDPRRIEKTENISEAEE